MSRDGRGRKSIWGILHKMSGSRKRILVADDDADQREVTQTILEANDYEVVMAENEAETLKRVEEDPPDLILLDVMMQHLDGGFQVCQQLRRDPRYKHIPIIMVTGVRQEMKMDFSPETDEGYLPADAFLEKPFNPDTLLEKVATLLRG